MRWLGLALALVAGSILAWDAFGMHVRPAPNSAEQAEIQRERRTGRVLSGIGITTGLLLIVASARRFETAESGYGLLATNPESCPSSFLRSGIMDEET
jgi:hypothetical protein